jgi:hypothetical protein
MTIREKVELLRTIKPSEDKDNPENTFVLTKELQVTIENIKDVPTKHGSKILLTVSEGENRYNLFVNIYTQNNLIEAYGKDDENWKGKIVNLKVEKDSHYKKEMVVAHPIK